MGAHKPNPTTASLPPTAARWELGLLGSLCEWESILQHSIMQLKVKVQTNQTTTNGLFQQSPRSTLKNYIAGGKSLALPTRCSLRSRTLAGRRERLL